MKTLSGCCLTLPLVLLLGACQLMPRPAGLPPPAMREAGSAAAREDLFAFTRRALSLSREALAEEIGTLRERIRQSDQALDQAKLALALTLPNQNQRDTNRALLAMTALPSDAPDLGPDARAMLAYVEVLLAWQAHEEDSLQSLLATDHGQGTGTAGDLNSLQAMVQRLRADQKRSEAQLDQVQGRLREEHARAELLQQKLDALGNLERSLTERKVSRPDPAK